MRQKHRSGKRGTQSPDIPHVFMHRGVPTLALTHVFYLLWCKLSSSLMPSWETLNCDCQRCWTSVTPRHSSRTVGILRKICLITSGQLQYRGLQQTKSPYEWRETSARRQKSFYLEADIKITEENFTIGKTNNNNNKNPTPVFLLIENRRYPGD